MVLSLLYSWKVLYNEVEICDNLFHLVMRLLASYPRVSVHTIMQHVHTQCMIVYVLVLMCICVLYNYSHSPLWSGYTYMRTKYAGLSDGHCGNCVLHMPEIGSGWFVNIITSSIRRDFYNAFWLRPRKVKKTVPYSTPTSNTVPCSSIATYCALNADKAKNIIWYKGMVWYNPQF